MPSAKPIQAPSQTCAWSSQCTAALWAIQEGAETEALTRQLARRYGRAIARRIVDTASARLWLAEGFPSGDVVTMLEARHRFELSASECQSHAIEVLLTVRQAMLTETESRTNLRREERHAAA